MLGIGGYSNTTGHKGIYNIELPATIVGDIMPLFTFLRVLLLSKCN